MLRPTTNRPILAFFDAIKNLRLRQLSLILKTGYDPNLMINARGQNGLQFMINYFNATDAHFHLQAPINKASYLSIAKLLLDSGLDPNIADLLTGETIVFDAIRFNDKEMVNLLLNYIDFTIRNKNGETILMCAARFGSKQMMKLILEHLRTLEMDGYFLRQRNRFGLTALELARAENLDCAKVLTKHLITYGHNANSVLSRSTSHHHLSRAGLVRPYNLHHASYRATAGGGALNNHSTRAQAACLLDDYSESEYSDCDVLTSAAAAGIHVPRGSVTRAMLTGYKTGAGLYDPKAAEFNQYLLEQQDLSPSSAAVIDVGGQQQQNTYNSAGLCSDDEDYFGIGNPSSSGLTRSRSCMLGPSGAVGGGANKQAMIQQQQQSSKFSKNKNQSNEPGQGSSNNNNLKSWDVNATGGPGRSTVG